MLHRFSRKKQSLLKIKVNKDDSIEMEGRLNTKEPNPIIVIGFENNRDGYSNIKQQSDDDGLDLINLDFRVQLGSWMIQLHVCEQFLVHRP